MKIRFQSFNQIIFSAETEMEEAFLRKFFDKDEADVRVGATRGHDTNIDGFQLIRE